MNKLAARLDDTDPAKVRDEVPRIIATEIKPRIFEYQNEMRAIAGRLFGDVLKRFATFNFSTLSLAYLAQLSPGEIVSTFLAATVGAAVPPVVDYAAERSNVRRKHAMAYLLGLARHAG